jgi:hypothetical protein
MMGAPGQDPVERRPSGRDEQVHDAGIQRIFRLLRTGEHVGTAATSQKHRAAAFGAASTETGFTNPSAASAVSAPAKIQTASGNRFLAGIEKRVAAG